MRNSQISSSVAAVIANVIDAVVVAAGIARIRLHRFEREHGASTGTGYWLMPGLPMLGRLTLQPCLGTPPKQTRQSGLKRQLTSQDKLNFSLCSTFANARNCG